MVSTANLKVDLDGFVARGEYHLGYLYLVDKVKNADISLPHKMQIIAWLLSASAINAPPGFNFSSYGSGKFAALETVDDILKRFVFSFNERVADSYQADGALNISNQSASDALARKVFEDYIAKFEAGSHITPTDLFRFDVIDAVKLLGNPPGSWSGGPLGVLFGFNPISQYNDNFDMGDWLVTAGNVGLDAFISALRTVAKIANEFLVDLAVDVIELVTPTWNPFDRDNPLAPRPVDPLVLDLDGNGVTLVSTANSRVQFDIDIDAFAERIGWVGPRDGLLAIDKNGNGRIDSAAELFGNATTDGFTVLDAFDTNKDKQISAADADFVKLRVWRDADSDGVTDAGELLTLGQLGITSISLTRVATNYQREGNLVAFEGSFTMNGQIRDVDAVFFAANQLLSKPILPATFKYNAEVFALPNLRGYGEVFDLWQKMSTDSTLRTQVKTLVDQSDTMTYAQFRAGFEAVLFTWAGVSAVSQTGRGQYIDGRQLTLIEKLYDTDWVRAWDTSTTRTHPDSWTAAQFTAMYEGIVDSMLLQFAVQTPYAYLTSGTTPGALATHPLLPLAQAGSFDYATNKVTMDLPQVFKALAAAAPATTDAAIAYYKKIVPVLNGLRLDQFGGDEAKFAAAVTSAAGAITDVVARTWAIELTLGATIVEGTAAAETSNGTSGRDLFVGSAGNDMLRGGAGSDTYLFRKGDGQDTIQDWTYGTGDTDTLVLGPGIRTIDVAVSQADDGRDFVLKIAGTADTITIDSGNSGYGIEQVRFADGTVWTRQTLLDRSLDGTAGGDNLIGDDRANVIRGKDGNDVLRGGAGADMLAGGRGNDTVQGGDGGDTYFFNRGDGQDVIYDYGAATGEIDTIQFGPGITAADLVVTQGDRGYDLVIALKGTTDQIIIDGGTTSAYQRIEQVRFADGKTLTSAQLLALSLVGTAGADTLRGDDAINTLRGGRGNDTLIGNGGADTYVFNPGDGQDVIQDYGWSTTETDALVFGAGIKPTDVVVTQADYGRDLVLTIRGTTDVITIDGGTGSGYGIEQVRFADGVTAWTKARMFQMSLAGTGGNNALYGNDANNTLTGNKGDDTLIGGYGADTYVFNRGDGQDLISDYGAATGEIDTIQFGPGITAADLVVTQGDRGYDLVIALKGTTDQIIIDGGTTSAYQRIEQVRFADGKTLTSAQLLALSLVGTAGADTLRGDDAINTLRGGRGNDTLIGNGGADTYVFNPGDGQDVIQDYGWSTTETDALVFGAGIKPTDVVVTQADYGRDLVLSIRGTTDVVTIDGGTGSGYGIEQVRFADGVTAWTKARMFQMSLAGTGGNDALYGNDANNTLTGNKGDDTLRGGYGADTYVFNRGDGQDFISDFGGSVTDIDVLSFGPGITSADILVSQANYGDDLVLSIRGTTDTVTIEEGSTNSAGYGYGIEQVKLADGTVLSRQTLFDRSLTGTDGVDYIVGDRRSNRIQGNDGADTLRGGDGADQFVYTDVDDVGDRIRDFSPGEDNLLFLAAGFKGGLVAGGNVGTSGRFVADTTGAPTAARGQFLYETDTGQLWWDADGTGAGTKVLVATFDGRPALTANDIDIV